MQAWEHSSTVPHDAATEDSGYHGECAAAQAQLLPVTAPEIHGYGLASLELLLCHVGCIELRILGIGPCPYVQERSRLQGLSRHVASLTVQHRYAGRVHTMSATSKAGAGGTRSTASVHVRVEYVQRSSRTFHASHRCGEERCTCRSAEFVYCSLVLPSSSNEGGGTAASWRPFFCMTGQSRAWVLRGRASGMRLA